MEMFSIPRNDDFYFTGNAVMGCWESPSHLVNNSFLISGDFDLMEYCGCAVFTYLPPPFDDLIATVTPTCLCE